MNLTQHTKAQHPDTLDPHPATSPPTSPPAAGATQAAPDTQAGIRRAIGWSALVKAATYLAGFVVLGVVLMPDGFGEGTEAEQFAVVRDHQALLYAWNAVLYLIGGVALTVLVLGLQDRLRGASPLAGRVATAFGLMWSGLLLASGMIAMVGQRAMVELYATDPDGAVTAWSAVQVVQDALGGGIELVGGVWILLVSWIGLRSGRLGRGLCRLGTVVGAAGVLTVVPQLEDIAAVFGVGFIAWFSWIGLTMLRGTDADRGHGS